MKEVLQAPEILDVCQEYYPGADRRERDPLMRWRHGSSATASPPTTPSRRGRTLSKVTSILSQYYDHRVITKFVSILVHCQH